MLATLVVVAGTGMTRRKSVAALVVVGVLATVAVTRTGRAPFVAAIGIALSDAVLLVTGR